MTTLRITVLGAGNIGGTLGRKWLARGHAVTLGVRDPLSERAQALRTEMYDGVPGDLFYQVGLVDDLLRLWFTLASGGRGRHLAFKLLSR